MTGVASRRAPRALPRSVGRAAVVILVAAGTAACSGDDDAADVVDDTAADDKVATGTSLAPVAASTVPTTDEPSAATSPSPTSSVTSAIEAGGGFGARWSSDLDGDVVNAVVGLDHVFVASEVGDALHVAALDLGTGDPVWDTTVADEGEWADEWNLSSTTPGLMTSYADADGGHLVLLDADTGDVVWDTPIDGVAYEMHGEIADGIADVEVSEAESSFVDLDTGDLLPFDEAYLAFGDGLAIQDGDTLEIGVDPFAPGAPGIHSITLEPGTEVVGLSDAGPVTLVGTAAGSLVGYVDGEPRWEVPLGPRGVDTFSAFGDVVLVRSFDEAANDYVFNWIEFDETGGTAIDAPPGFAPAGIVTEPGQSPPVFFGTIDDAEGAVVRFDGPVASTTATFDIAGMDGLGRVGNYLVVDKGGDELDILALSDGSPVTSVTLPEPGPFQVRSPRVYGDNEIVVIRDGHTVVTYG